METTMTPSAVIAFVIMMICAVGMLAIPIVTLINHHRIRNGIEPLNKGKVRNIVIVNKRAAEYEYSNAQYAYNRFGKPDIQGEPDGTYKNLSVDFRVNGRGILYTKSVDEEIFERLEVGQAYKVRIRDGCIDKLIM